MEVAKRGRVALVVCSSAFATLARAQASALGCAELPIAVIPHPFGSRSRDELREIARDCLHEIVMLVTEGADQ